MMSHAVFAAILELSAQGAWAQDCVLANPDPDDPTRLRVAFVMGTDEVTPPTVQISVPDVEGMTVEAEYRLVFDGYAAQWTSGPWIPDPDDVIIDRVVIPEEADWSEDQQLVLSALSVRAIGSVAGTVVYRSSAARLRVAFPYGVWTPMFLDDAWRALLAPYGVVLGQTGSDDLGAWETVEPEVLP